MTKEEFKAAYRVAMAEEFSAIPTEEERIDCDFSPRFTNRMNRLLRQANTVWWHWINTAGKRSAVIVAAMLILFFAVMRVDTGIGSQQTDDTGTDNTGNSTQQTDHSGTDKTGISFLRMDKNAKVDIEIIPEFRTQGGDDVAEQYSLSGIGFIDSLTA